MSVTEARVTLSSSSASATEALAARLAGMCVSGDCVLLSGDLGVGKTTFARGFIQNRCPSEEVVSPTFTLLQLYQAGEVVIRHFDLYRLENKQELEELGFREALADGITLIEWPEIAQSELPEEALSVIIQMDNRSGHRTITFSGHYAAWQGRLAGLTNDE